MSISRSRAVVASLAVVAALAVLALAGVGPSAASTPPAHTVTAPPVGQTVTVTWTGTISPQATPTSDCNDSIDPDEHTVNYSIPPSVPQGSVVDATFKISWTPGASSASSDEILTVNNPDGSELGSSDGSSNSEVVSASDPKPGAFQVLACGYANSAPQDYTGTLTLTTHAPEPSVPSANAQGLQFSAAVPADNQRDEAEPLMEIDGDGRTYTCGPTGFSNASDYAQVSTDGGDQFHLMGTPPRGQQGLGGGGDCGLATAPTKNADGFFQYAYAGLGPLTGFTTSTSPDGGRTIFNAGPQGNTNTAQGGGADRQWLTFLDDHTVLLSYNQQQPRNVVVQKSTDGGLTYLTGNDAVAAANPDFPGPMHSMPASLLTPGAPGRVAFFGWNTSDANFSYVNFAISDSTGLVWKNCLAQKIPVTQSGGLQAFTVADHDNAGNIYLAYADKKAFHTYLTTLTVDKLRNCNQDPTTTAPDALRDPGWSPAVQVDRDNVRSTIFPWLVAGGEPGRVAVAYYGTETDGDPNPGTFKASWDVYVDQSLNALSPDRTFGQVKATTHPSHYDSICLQGLGCDLSSPAGDRSLGDFFAIDYNPHSKKLSVVFNRGNKKPDEATGHVAEPDVVTQIAGPSNGGGTLATDTARTPVRTSSTDPAGDALVNFSALTPSVVQLPNRTPTAKNEPAMDFLSQNVDFEVDPATGKRVTDGGFTVTLKLADLSSAALQQAMSDTTSASLLWVFRFVNGYQAAAASARYSPAGGFTFGYNDYATASAQCGSDSDKCVVYPGDKPIKGKVDQATGTITLSVPRAYLRGLTGPTGFGQRPTETKAVPGTRFYDATAFSLGNPSPDPGSQSFMTPADNLPAMDFLLPGLARGGGAGSGAAGGSGGRCVQAAGFRTVSATPKGGRIAFGFTRRVNHPVTVDVFQESKGRTVLRERLVARFTKRSRSFTWNGRANRRGRKVTDGYYIVRYQIRDAKKQLDTRRFAMRRAGGRFSKRPSYYRRDTCATLRSYKLIRPVFGGVNATTLNIAYRLQNAARVQVSIFRGSKLQKRYPALNRRAGFTYRFGFPAARHAKGDYMVRLTLTRGGKKVVSTLVSRRL
jgi:hypothetical protein